MPRHDEEDPRRLRRLRGRARRQRDLRSPDPRHRHHPGRARRVVRALRREPAGVRDRLGPPSRRQAVPRVPRARLQGLDPLGRRLVRPVLGAAAGDPGVGPDGAAAARRAAGRPDHGEGAPHHQGAGGRGLGRDREPARPDGLLRRLEGRDRPVPGEDPLGVVQQRLDPALAAARRLRSRCHHDPRSRCTSSSETSIDESCARRSAGGRRSRSRRSWCSLIPLGAHPRLHVPAQDDEPHAEPARPDGPRRLPRLVPAHRRRHQVPPEGGHHAGGGRPAGLRAGARGRRDVDVPGLPRDPDRAAARRREGPRRRRVLRAGGLEPLGDRRADGRLGERQQVRAARRAARRRAAHRLRAAAAARGRRRRHAGRHDEPAGHRPGAAERLDLRGRLHRQPVHPHAVRRLLPLPGRRAGRAHPDPVRHARRRERARRRLHGRVHRASGSSSSSSASSAPRSRSPRSRPRCSSAAGRSPGSTAAWRTSSGRSSSSPS